MHRRAPLLVVLALVLAGCGIDEGVVAREAAEAAPATTAPTTSTTTPPEDEPPPPASPFTIRAVPDVFGLVVEGRGEDDPAGVVPVTVLAPGGEPVGPGVVLVEAVDEEEEEGDLSRWASLADGGIRAWGVGATDDDLRAVLDATTPPAGPGRAPGVDDPPGELEVVGHIDADGVVALRAGIPGDADPVPGPASAHVAAWSTPDGGSLLVMTLPAGTLDPAAVVTETRPPRRAADEERDAVAEEVTVGDATGVVTTTARPATGDVVRRELAVEAPWGDVLLVVSRGPAELDADALVAVAESVTPT